MDGKGEFKHRDGHVLGPHFRNNLFFMNDGPNSAINPFKSEEEIKGHLKRIEEFHAKINDAAVKEECKVNLHRIRSGPDLAETLTKIRANGRTPMIVSALEHPQDTADIQAYMWEEGRGPDDDERYFYLRSLGHILDQDGYEAVDDLKQQFVSEYHEALSDEQARWFFTVNFDEDDPNEKLWKFQYDPDLDRLLRGKTGFPDEIWKGTKALFKTGPENCHPAVKHHLEIFYEREWARIQNEAKQEWDDACEKNELVSDAGDKVDIGDF